LDQKGRTRKTTKQFSHALKKKAQKPPKIKSDFLKKSSAFMGVFFGGLSLGVDKTQFNTLHEVTVRLVAGTKKATKNFRIN